jgi:hypothetical protein
MAETTQAAGPDPNLFFANEVPTAFTKAVADVNGKIQKLERLRDDMKAAELLIRVNLTGDGGGLWDIKVAGGTASVGPKSDLVPHVGVTQSVDDWRATVTGAVTFGLAPGTPGQKPNPAQQFTQFAQKSKVDKIKTLNGTIRFVVTDIPTRGEWMLDLTFGNAAPEPKCTVATKDSDAKEMASGKLNPQAAFMAGKMRVQGDMGLAMQLGTLLM